MTKLGQRLAARMKELGLEQDPLAEASGVSQGTISRILSGESGGRPASVAKLAAALHTSPAYLRGETDDAGPAPPSVAPSPSASHAALEPDDLASPLERALSDAFDGKRHQIRDAEAVKSALRSTYQKQRVETDLVDAARTWLDCAAQLRREGVPVTTEELLLRVTIGRKPSAHDRATAERIDAEAEERQRADAAARGIEWGSKRGALEALVAKSKKGRRDAE